MLKKTIFSFKYALAGLVHTLKTQSNFLIHLVISAIVCVLAAIYNFSVYEWIILGLTISIGLAIELINTAIESVVDLTTDKWHHHAKAAKDVSAAAMLIFSIGSILVGLLLFIPKL